MFKRRLSASSSSKMSTCNSSSSLVIYIVIFILPMGYIIHVTTALPVTSQLSRMELWRVSGAPPPPPPVDSSSSMSSVVGMVIAVASAVCLVITLVVCLCNCFKKPPNSSQTARNGFPMSPTVDRSFDSTTSGEFTMFPPAGSSHYLNGPDDVYFEPLPDINSLNAPSNKMVKGDKPRPIMFSHVAGRSLSFQDWFEDPYANFPRMRLRYVRELGSGWFGQVVEGEAVNIIANERKTKVVVKILMTGASTTDQMYFLHEVKPFRDTSHPNVLKLLGKCLESDPFLIILEHCVFDDFKSYLIKHRSESESLLRKNFLIRMAWNVAAGLQYLHSRGFVITDLAARNCLVTSDLVVKIGDYGNSIEKYKEEYYCAGGIAVPVRWCAPETLRCTETIMETKEVTVEANVWSFGVVVWEIFEFGKLPYYELSDDEFIQKVIIERSEALKRPLTPCHHMDHIYHLIRLCHMEADIRPTMSVLCDLLEGLYSSDENGDAEVEFEHRWSQLHSQTFPEVFNSLSSTPSLLHMEDAPLSDLSLNFVDVTHSLENDESRLQSNDFDVDDASWKRILESSKKESGDFIRMIQEKSQSVQDLMKLTVIDIESGSESDAPCLNGEDSLDSVTSKENNEQTDPSVNEPLMQCIPNILIDEASTAVTVEESKNKDVLSLQPNNNQPFLKFVVRSNSDAEDAKTQDAVGDEFLSSFAAYQRRTSTPHKADNSFVVIENSQDVVDAGVDTLDVFFGDPHMPTMSTIDHSIDTTKDEAANSEKQNSHLTYEVKESECLESSLDEGLEMSEEEEEDSSYSVLTAATNRSEEEDCILMVDLETNRAVLVDVPTVSWEESRVNVNEYKDNPAKSDCGHGQSNGHRFRVERVLDEVEVEEVVEAEAEEEDEDELSDQLVISHPSPVLMEVKQDVEMDRGESPEWEASTESVSSICTSPSATSSSSSGEFDCSTKIANEDFDHLETNEIQKESEEIVNSISVDEAEPLFRLSSWDKDAIPSKSVLRSYNRLYLNEGKKTVSFHFPTQSVVYEYPKEEESDEDEDELDEKEMYNGIFDGDFENALYADHSRPSWSYVYDDRFTDYSTIADWDLGAEEMPELEEVDDYDEEEGDDVINGEREAMAKKPRSTWGTMYKLSDLAYEEEEDEDDTDVEGEPNGMPFNGPHSFDISSYFAHYNPNAFYPGEVGPHENNIDMTPSSEEQDENYWLQRLISTEELIENTECPFDQDLMDDEEEDEDDINQQSLSWNVNELKCDDNGLQLGPLIEGAKHNGLGEVVNEKEVQYENSG